jgi:hypothetical protein
VTVTTTESGFQVQHDSLDSAARSLPEQVSALGDTRQTLTSREVPASAFANVDASAEAGAAHARTVSENASKLAEAGERLDKMIGDIRATTAEVRAWDGDTATDQTQQGKEQIELAQAQVETGGGFFGRGGAFLEGDQINLRPRDGSVPSVTIPNNVGAKGFEVGPGYDILSREHTYRVDFPTFLSFDDNAGRFGQAIANNPVPTFGDQPASPTGTRNDALWNDYVRSYTVPSPDPGRYTDITVNYTIAGEHRLAEGYVIRYGERDFLGNVRLVSYGEGNSLLQHPLNPFNGPAQDVVWNANHLEILGTVLRQR